MLSCCGKVFTYSFLFCRICILKEEEDRQQLHPKSFASNFWGAVYQLIFSIKYLLSNIYLERNHR